MEPGWQMRKQASWGDVDFITGDWLAENNIAQEAAAMDAGTGEGFKKNGTYYYWCLRIATSIYANLTLSTSMGSSSAEYGCNCKEANQSRDQRRRTQPSKSCQEMPGAHR